MAKTLVEIIADFNTTLANKVEIGATTADLTSATDDDGDALPSGTYAFTIDRKNSSKEYIECTLSGTSLTNIKTIDRGTGLATAGFAKTHRKGAEVIISNFAAIKRINNLLDGKTNLDSDVPLKYDGAPSITDADEIATKAYVDATATGTTNYDQEIMSGVLGEDCDAGDYVYLKAADGKWWKTDASASATAQNVAVGVVQTTAVADASTGILTGGLDKTQSYIAGSKYYLSDTAGEVSNTPGTVEVFVGEGNSDNYLVFQHLSNLETLTSDEKDALEGTSGTPSSTNKYVTDDDTSETSVANKVLRLNGDGEIGIDLPMAISTFTAAENISDRESVSVFPYYSDGGIEYNSSDSLDGNQASSNTTVAKNMTVAVGSNKMMIAFVTMRQPGRGDALPGAPTYGGDALTEIAKSGNRGDGMTGVYYLADPSEGTNSFSWEVNSVGASDTLYYTINVYTFDNVDTSAIADSGSGSGTTFNYTPSSVGEIVIPAFFADNTMSTAVNFNKNTINNDTQSAGTDQGIFTGWSGQIQSPIQNTFSVTGGDTYRYVALAPNATPTLKSVAKSDASNTDNAAELDKYELFTGIALEAITAGNTGRIAISGLVTGLTGLKPYAQYYVSDTPGEISTSAGTNSKKVGYAISETELVVVKDN